jgi:nuclear pore complex protein Nup62
MLHSYVLATELHAQLQDLSGSLAQMIDSVNSLSAGERAEEEDPLGQIVQILSSHLESLQWIDGAVRDVESKVGDVEKRVRDAGGASGLATAPRNGFGLQQ